MGTTTLGYYVDVGVELSLTLLTDLFFQLRCSIFLSIKQGDHVIHLRVAMVVSHSSLARLWFTPGLVCARQALYLQTTPQVP